MSEYRRPGRPPLDESSRSLPVTTRLPESVYDRVCQRATQARVNPADFIRKAVLRAVEDSEDD